MERKLYLLFSRKENGGGRRLSGTKKTHVSPILHDNVTATTAIKTSITGRRNAQHNNTGVRGKRRRDFGSLKTEEDDLIMINYRCCSADVSKSSAILTL